MTTLQPNVPASTHTQAGRRIAQEWSALLANEPKVRARDAAQRLNVAEGQLVASRVGSGTTRLRAAWNELVPSLGALGRVMALTRNDVAVHERHGRYEQISVRGAMGLVVGPDIDLRLFLGAWKSAFAFSEAGPRGTRDSLQFFDRHGDAVHKLYATDETDRGAWAAIVARFTLADADDVLQVEPRDAPAPPLPDERVDVAAFRAAWLALQDTHDFFGLVQRFGLGRTQALRLAPDGHAMQVPTSVFRELMEVARDEHLPVMLFVGNAGGIQIHTGPITRLVATPPWFNVLDPHFNLHVREDGVHEAWIVRKPTRDGVVTSLELFDAAGENVLLMFGERKPGRAEDAAWRAAADRVAARA